MRRIDLHCHTTASDGTLAPAALVELAASSGLVAVAPTDHDTVEGLGDAMAAGGRLGVEIVAGVELSTTTRLAGCDVLGYLFDHRHAGFSGLLASVREYRMARAPRMLAKLEAIGVHVTMDDVMKEVTGGSVGRPHVANALVRKGYAGTLDEAFQKYLGAGKPAYVPKERVTAAAGIQAIHDAGGVAVLAHPGFVHPAIFPDLLHQLVAAGLDGIEALYPHHDATARAHFRTLARHHGLVATGGSDFHGANKPDIRLGTGTGDLEVPYEVLDALRARADG